MKYEYYYIEDTNNKSNCVVRSFCKVFNKTYEEVYQELCNIQKELNKDSYVDIEVFEKYMIDRNIHIIEGKSLNSDIGIKVKDLKLDKGTYIVFCYDRKDWYHMLCIIDGVVYDKSDDGLELYVIRVYKK